jgi:1,4-dihydroxy-2-naphthoate octaprenyltransferase
MEPVADASRPSAVRLWLSASRLRTLPAAAAPVVLGTAFAAGEGAFHAASAACALVSALLIQVGTNYANDAEDFVRGADTAARVGPKRAVNEGWVTAGQMRRAAALAFGLAFLVGLYLVWRGGWPVLALGLVAIASGYGYTKGRYALAYTGLADVFVLTFFGPVAVGGTYFLQALALPAWVLVAGLGPGALATAILIANNVRDEEQDRAANKRTLVVRYGRPFGIGLYAACFALAASAAAASALFADGHAGAWAAVAVAGLGGVRLLPALNRAYGAAAAPVLGQTAAVLMLYSLAFSLGWWLA